MDLYCVKCKKRTPTIDPVETVPKKKTTIEMQLQVNVKYVILKNIDLAKLPIFKK